MGELSRLPQRFLELISLDVAVAEVGDQDLWQLSEIGVACVTSDARHGQEVISKVASYVAGLKFGEAELLNYETEVVTVF